MPTINDWRDHLIATAQAHRRRDPATAQRRAEVARVAQTVLDHPGWQMFHDRLSELRSLKTMTLHAMETQHAHANLPPYDLECLRLDLRRLAGVIEGVTIALDLIPEAIRRGARDGEERAAGEPLA